MKKNFPRKIRPGSRSAVAFIEGSCRRRSTLDRRLSTDSRPQPKTLNQEPSEKLHLLALSCTYLQLLAANCSSSFSRTFCGSGTPSGEPRPDPVGNQKLSTRNQLKNCTYLQLLAPNCSSHFPRSFLRLRSSDGGATSQLTRQTTNSTSAHRQFNISPHQLNSAEPHLHPATPNYTQLHQKNFSLRNSSPTPFPFRALFLLYPC